MLSSSLLYPRTPRLYLTPGLMLPAVEAMAIEDHFYYDNRSGLVLPSRRLPSPVSVSLD